MEKVGRSQRFPSFGFQYYPVGTSLPTKKKLDGRSATIFSVLQFSRERESERESKRGTCRSVRVVRGLLCYVTAGCAGRRVQIVIDAPRTRYCTYNCREANDGCCKYGSVRHCSIPERQHSCPLSLAAGRYVGAASLPSLYQRLQSGQCVGASPRLPQMQQFLTSSGKAPFEIDANPRYRTTHQPLPWVRDSAVPGRLPKKG